MDIFMSGLWFGPNETFQVEEAPRVAGLRFSGMTA
jgi:hypothetical protein